MRLFQQGFLRVVVKGTRVTGLGWGRAWAHWAEGTQDLCAGRDGTACLGAAPEAQPGWGWHGRIEARPEQSGVVKAFVDSLLRGCFILSVGKSLQVGHEQGISGWSRTGCRRPRLQMREVVAWSEVPPEAEQSGQLERSGEGI